MKMRQRDLEMALQRLEGFGSPRADLEQYMTPAPVAADILFSALAAGDIDGRRVADLGCGTGIFGIGAAMLGAADVRGFDVDAGALEAARRNAEMLDAAVEFSVGDVSDVSGSFDTVLMNPPFGAQKRGADRPFLEKAAGLAPVVWSIHNSGTEDFVEKLAASLGLGISFTKSYKFRVKHMFRHHRREAADISVTAFRLERREY